MPRIVTLLALVALFLSCSAGSRKSSSGSGESTGAGTPANAKLMIEPADALLPLPDGKPAKFKFTAKLAGDDGSIDVSAEATFTIADESLGSFSGAELAATGKPGKTTVTAKARDLEASTSVSLKTEKVILAPGAPADAPSKFGTTIDPNKSPELVYPADGVLVPPNMNVLEMHFLPGGDNDLFELSFASELLLAKIYLPCNQLMQGCAYTPSIEVWKLVAEAGRGKGPISYSIRGVKQSAPASVGVSAKRSISFGEENIVGGLYYWNAGAGTTMRYEFGKSGQSAETYLDAPTAGAAFCVGCHVLSRQGGRMAVGMDIPAPSPYKVFDVATKASIYSQGTTFGGGSNFFAFSPDAKQIATSNGVSVVIRDSANGNALVDPLVASGTMPDWSPDGKRIVFAQSSSPPPCGAACPLPSVGKAALFTTSFDGSKWEAPMQLVPYGGQNNYYPAFSPDAQFVLFNRSPGDKDSYDAPDAQVWCIEAKGGNPVKLAQASTGGDSWPRWAPDLQKYKNGGLMWLTFSSRRAYGLRLSQGKQAQIWMTAFDPSAAKAGKDPSYPAFWLPFQNVGSGNHIAQWVTKVARKPCFMNSDCPSGEKCKDGFCEPDIK